MQTEKLTWQHDGMSIELAADWSGQGPLVLLLPALSSISTRREMHPLQERLCANYRTVSIDWPGFGDQPRARHDWRPEIYSDFLSYLPGTVLPPVHAVIAAGHAATFALLHARAHPGSFKRLVLVAPTWRGPLPTMMDGQRPVFDRICRLVDLPIIGLLLYRLNVRSRYSKLSTPIVASGSKADIAHCCCANAAAVRNTVILAEIDKCQAMARCVP